MGSASRAIFTSFWGKQTNKAINLSDSYRWKQLNVWVGQSITSQVLVQTLETGIKQEVKSQQVPSLFFFFPKKVSIYPSAELQLKIYIAHPAQ